MFWVTMLINILSLIVRVDHGGAVTAIFCFGPARLAVYLSPFLLGFPNSRIVIKSQQDN